MDYATGARTVEKTCTIEASCGALFKCRFDSTVDLDAFKFAGSANGTGSIKIAGTSGSLWELFGPTGSSRIAAGFGLGQSILPSTGNHTIRTINFNDNTGDYLLSLEGVSQAFQCGPPISFGNVKNGNFDAPADTDTFQFVGQASQVVSIKITGTSGSLWELFGPTGSSRIAAGFGVGQATLSASGTHTIRVSNFSNLTGTYTLSLQKLGGP